MKTKNYSPFEKSIAKNICMFLCSSFLILNAHSQTIITNENFPNSFNTGFTRPINTTFSETTGTWGAYGSDDDATVVVSNGAVQSSPWALKIANFANSHSTASTAIGTSPVVNLSAIPSGSVVTLQFWLNTFQVANGNNSFNFYVEFWNGSTWVSQFTKTANQLYDTYGPSTGTNITLTIPAAYLTSTFKYRFRGVNNANLNIDNYLYIDDIIISYSCAAGRTPDFSGEPIKYIDGGAVGGGFEVGDVYRYVNAITSPVKMNADVKIEAIVNAEILDLDENGTGTGLGVKSRFQPTIRQDLSSLTADREGYVQFAVTFKVAANNALAFFENLTFHHYDIDGHTNGTTGYFRETAWETGYSTLNVNTPSDLTDAGSVTDGGFNWRKFLGEAVDHDGFTSDPDIYLTTTIASGNTIRFRMGYKFVKGNGGSHAYNTRMYAADFSCFTVASNTPLPVRLTSFSGSYRNQKAMLNWTTENEMNVENFEIQRSLNGSDFSTVGVALANESNTKADYQFPDDVSGISVNAIYYRLKMVDKDGTFKYSQVVILRKDSKAINGITINPNPVVNGIANIRMNSASKGIVEIRVVDMAGKVLLRQNNAITEGNNSIAINNLSGLQVGIYTVQMINGDDIASSKLSIVR